jgi:hypothetical protein
MISQSTVAAMHRVAAQLPGALGEGVVSMLASLLDDDRDSLKYRRARRLL